MGDDGKNMTPEVEGANESSLDDDLLGAFDELAESLPQNGADDGDGGDGDETDGENGAADDAEPDEGDGAGDTDYDGEDGQTDAEDADDAQADDDTDEASAGEPAKEPVAPAVPSKEDRIAARKLAALEKYAKAEGYESVEDMLAAQEGVDAETVKQRFEADELTVEEKAALYDKEHAKSKEAALADAEQRGREMVLAEIHEAFPETKDTVKRIEDIADEKTFRNLIFRDGKTVAEAFKMTNASKIKPKVAPPNGKAHLIPNAKASRSGGTISVPASELAYLRETLPDLSDKEIGKYYRRINS